MAVGLAWMVVSLLRILSPYMSYRLTGDESLPAYAWPAESAGLVIQAVVGLSMLVTGLVLTIQQLKVIRRRG
jgi:hypothetical protein